MELMITNARVSFANGLFTAQSVEGGGPKFGADFIIMPDSKVYKIGDDGKKSEISLKEAELEVANEAWKGKGKDMLEDLEASKKAIRNGNKRKNKSGDIYEGYEDRTYITAKNKQRPTLINADRSPVTEEDGVIYSGCYVNVRLSLYANTKPTSKGVFAGLKGVQFSKAGDAFGGGARASADEFDDVSAGSDAEDFA